MYQKEHNGDQNYFLAEKKQIVNITYIKSTNALVSRKLYHYLLGKG